MSVRTYNPSVRVGNWNEDLCLEEDLLKDFLQKKEKGELLIDHTHNLVSKILQPVELSTCKDSSLHFGDLVCIYNPNEEVTLSINLSESKLHEAEQIEGPCGVSGSKILTPCIRNTFVITSVDGSQKVGESLGYAQHFLLCSLSGLGGDLKLQSDRATFMKNAKKSRKQEVLLSGDVSYQSHWQILHFDPQQRLETEGMPVKTNQRIMFNHCKTNQRLCVLSDFSFRTPFGREFEVVADTVLDSHKAEKPENHWVLIANV